MEEASFDNVDLGIALVEDFKIGGAGLAEDCEAKDKKLASRDLFLRSIRL